MNTKSKLILTVLTITGHLISIPLFIIGEIIHAPINSFKIMISQVRKIWMPDRLRDGSNDWMKDFLNQN